MEEWARIKSTRIFRPIRKVTVPGTKSAVSECILFETFAGYRLQKAEAAEMAFNEQLI